MNIFVRTKKKKGNIAVMPYVILTTVFILVWSIYIANFNLKAKESKEVEACRFSVFRNSELRAEILAKKFIGLEIPSSEIAAIECPKRKLLIDTKMTSAYEDKEFGAKDHIAEAMRLCWYQWGRGKLSPFDESFFDSKNKFCAVCYDVKFDDSFSRKYAKLDNFLNFLAQYNVPDGGTRYINYLTNSNHTWEITQEMKLQFIDSIDTSKDYAILYTIDKPGTIVQSMTGAGGAAVGTYAGCKFGGLLTPFLGPLGVVIGCGGGFVIGGYYGYAIGETSLVGDSKVMLLQSSVLREHGCDVLYQ
ncbi:MAG: hypothetical protein QS98_C0006G0032 [archaeon GW2011_AR3]|nr:MAG: hypothetical protein QS98_C0006G0032 [archaeon GW2011_AR3]